MAIYKTPAGKQEVINLYQELLTKWPVEFQQHFIDTGFGKTHVIECGDAEKPAVVFLHGSMSNALMWQPEVALYAKEFRVLVVDVLGEPGLSDEVRLDVKTDQHALWLQAIFQSLAIQRAAVVGISLGGWLAIDFACHFPEQVTALVALCPAGIGQQKQSFIFKALAYSLLGKKGSQKLTAALMGEMSAETKAFAENVRPVYRIFDVIRKHFRPRIVKFPPFTNEQLEKLTMPFYLIIGGSDVFFNFSATPSRLRDLLPNTVIDFEPGRGHLIMNQGKAINTFLLESNISH